MMLYDGISLGSTYDIFFIEKSSVISDSPSTLLSLMLRFREFVLCIPSTALCFDLYDVEYEFLSSR